MVPCGNTPHPETFSAQSFCEGHQNQRALTPNAPKQIMENYDEPCMIKWQHRGSVRYFVAGRPAVILAHRIWWWKLTTCWLYKWSFRHWDGPFRFNLTAALNAGTHLTSLPTSHPETDSMVKVEGLDPLVSTVKRASKSSVSLPAPFMACQKSRDVH